MSTEALDPDARRNSRARVAAGSMLQGASRAVVLASGILLAAYLTRHLSVADYGSYAVAILVVSWVGAALGTATTAGSIRLLAAHADGRRFAVTMLQAAGGAGLMASLLTMLAAPLVAAMFESPGFAWLLAIVALELPLGATAAVYSGVLTGEGRFAPGAASWAAGALSRLVLAVFLVELGLGVTGAALSLPLAALVHTIYGRMMTGVPVLSREGVGFGRLWEQTRLLAGASFALRISQRMDLMAVRLLSGSAVASGYYAGAQNLALGPLLAFQGSPGVVTQAVARARANGHHEEARDLARTFLRTSMAYGGLIVAMGGLAGDAVRFVLGEDFGPAAPVLVALLWASAFRVLANCARALINAAGERGRLVRSLVLVIVAGAGLYGVAIPLGGIVWGAIAAAVFSAAVAAVSVRGALTVVHVDFPWLSLARIAVATSVGMLVAASVPGTGALVIARACLTTTVYGLALFGLREWQPRAADAASLVRSLQHAVGVRR